MAADAGNRANDKGVAPQSTLSRPTTKPCSVVERDRIRGGRSEKSVNTEVCTEYTWMRSYLCGPILKEQAINVLA